MLSLTLLVQWIRRTHFGRSAFDDGGQGHLQIQALELLVVLVVALFSTWIFEYQRKTQEQTNWEFQDIILGLLFCGLWVCPVVLLSGKFGFVPSAGKFGLTRQGGLSTVAKSLGYFVVAHGLTALTLFITMFIGAWLGEESIPVHETLEKLKESSTTRPLIMLAVLPVFVAPLIEELIFRGLLQTVLIRLFSRIAKTDSPLCSASCRWLGIVIAAIVFASTHADWQHWPALLVLAVCMGYSYEKEGNLLVPILVHSLFNLLPILIIMKEAPAFY